MQSSQAAAARSTSPAEAAADARQLQAQQLALHGSNVPWTSAGALMLALLDCVLLWRAVAQGPLLAWLAGVLAVLAWRWGCGTPCGGTAHPLRPGRAGCGSSAPTTWPMAWCGERPACCP